MKTFFKQCPTFVKRSYRGGKVMGDFLHIEDAKDGFTPEDWISSFHEAKNPVHIPNEGKRSAAYAARLKRMGMRPGFPDLFIPLARGIYHGLFIEMKYAGGRASGAQEGWLRLLSREGYAVSICYGFDEAKRIIEKYERLGAAKSE